MRNKIKNILNKLPKSPGVYFFYDRNQKLIYIGKASVLKHRVTSYFTEPSFDKVRSRHDNKTGELISQISNIKYRITNTIIEALVLESNLIKRYQPKYNIREKDDKSFAQIAKTDEDFPRFLIIRPTEKEKIDSLIDKFYGPYTSTSAVKELLAIFRRIFTFRDCTKHKFLRYQKRGVPCLFYPLNLCLAPCVSYITKFEYKKIIHQISQLLEGKTKRVIANLKKQMNQFAKAQKFEEAGKIRNRIYAFQHINDVAFIKQERSLEQIKNIPNHIECYDVSNLGKDFAVGSMVVFTGREIDNTQYRRFRVHNANLRIYANAANNKILNSKYKIQNTNRGDPQMLAQIIDRRFNHLEWTMPDLIILDGGKGQLSAVLNILRTKKIKLPVIAVAKGPPFALRGATGGKPTRKGIHLFKNLYAKNIVLDKKFIERIRDEAHRFAITYHRKLKNKNIH